MKNIFLVLFLLTTGLAGRAQSQSLEGIRAALEAASVAQEQEKVYVHTDNMCYFVGDTLWYKAYVVSAGDLRHTDKSRVLYVELLSPDGLLVERQKIIVSDKGFSCGSFTLRDSLYSGYYELRAYTRWMLNFNATVKRHSKNDADLFYNRAMARDYFRQWDGLYSRVLPVYERPSSVGDYTYKYIYDRPKQSLPKESKPSLSVSFYPEGGSMVVGVPCRVAFEATNQDGAAADASGTIAAGGQTIALKPTHAGRGAFTITPTAERLSATFQWAGKSHSFRLPKAEAAGVALTVDGGRVSIASKGLPEAGKGYGLSVICRGKLRHFQEITLAADGTASLSLPPLPTGVNDITVFDSSGRILADRLVFINNHDYDGDTISINAEAKRDFKPYERIDVALSCANTAEPATLSVAIRDTRTDEPTYNDGDIMTDLLLSSELKGFVANPAYYFADNSQERRDALDLLMMVQGWRKYKWQELADTAMNTRRYKPETGLTLEGAVYKPVDIPIVHADEISGWFYGVGYGGSSNDDETQDETAAATEETESEFITIGQVDLEEAGPSTDNTGLTLVDIGSANDQAGVNHGGLKREVLVEAELSFGYENHGAVQKTHNGGRYLFEVPPFYGLASLNMKAYNESDSVDKSMTSGKDRGTYRESATPDYYVKRDLFYPATVGKYSYYQNHAPEYVTPTLSDAVSELSMENDNHLLRNVNVKGKKRGRRAIDYDKPAFVADVYDMYNLITDYGLSYGSFDKRQFPVRVCRFLYGNMGRYDGFNVAGRFDGKTFYRNFKPSSTTASFITRENISNLFTTLKLQRLLNIRVFSDYEPRNEDAPMETSIYRADATVDFVGMPGNTYRVSYRDRHIMFPGFNMQADFYSPDYSRSTPETPTDYRRTLYWNPNAQTDAQGNLNITLYNNSKDTRIKVSAAGITPDGRLLRTSPGL